jgi:hypothetical protein
MKVRLKKPATVVTEIGHHWQPAGAEVEIPDDHFDAEMHESLEADAAAMGPQAAADEPDEDGYIKPRKRK